MRKAQKQEIMDMLQTLHEAHEEIKNNIDRKNYILAQDLLSQCQEGAISIGTAIEAFEGEGFVTVGYIETYCDVVFSCHEELNGNDANGNKLYKNLKKQLLRIENSVKNDIPVRKEVAFFPYKASMWDALESVYLAAKEDSDCDAYCVPIPYYDRNPDGSLGQMHYEGREYPKNIEVIDWQTYNFEQRQPDAIYIHNPYDDWNLVTCVHPRYFSNNLKKYTDKLVYIPYFVLDEIEPDDQARIDGMKHFIWTPGVINADKVIVQSEKMKQIYVNEYLKAAQTNGLQGNHLDRKYLEEKFLGLGSPKFDKVQNTKKEDLEIPEDWLRIIQKPDGSWKKIIFYNTSIAALLENNEKMLDKMKDVFKTFKENQDEVALLWRPHPLIKTTVSAMRPQLWMEYEKLVNQYKQEGWGIYDVTSDMDRAVVLSDGYYGDQSSVVPVYQQTGKPVMIQDVNLTENLLWKCNSNNKRKIMIEDAVCFEDQICFCAQNFNSLFCLDILTNEVRFLGKFQNEPYGGERLYASMKLVDSKIYFIPFYAKRIAVFDIKSEKISYIELDRTVLKNTQNKPLFMNVESYKNYLFVFPVFSKTIIRLNTDNNELEYNSEWLEHLTDIDVNKQDGYFRRQGIVSEGKIIIPFCNTNAVLELDCNTMQSKIYNLGSEKRGYSGICFDNQNFWLSPRESGNLVKWNKEMNTVGIINMYKGKMKQNPYAYVGISYYENKVILFPAVGEEADICEEDVVILDGQYNFAKEDKDILYYYELSSGVLTVINKVNNDKYELTIAVDYIDVDMQLLFEELKEQNKYMIENKELNINQFFDAIISNKELPYKKDANNNGKIIYLEERSI